MGKGFLGGLFGGRKAPAKKAAPKPEGPTARHEELAETHEVTPLVIYNLYKAVKRGLVPKDQRDTKVVELITTYRQIALTMGDAAVPDDETARHLTDAHGYFTEGDFDAALHALDQAAESAVNNDDNPNNPSATRLASGANFKAIGAKIERLKMDFRKASDRYQEAFEMTPTVALTTRVGYLHDRGMCDFDAGDLMKAEAALKTVLSSLRKKLGGNDKAVGKAMLELGELYMQMGQVGNAEKNFRGALEIYEAAFGDNAMQLDEPLGMLASLHIERGVLYRAEPYLHRQLEIIGANYGHNAIRATEPLKRLALLYRDSKRAEDAIPLMTQVITILQGHHKGSHADIADARILQGSIFEKLGQHNEAETVYTQAVAICDQVYGNNSPAVAGALVRLAGAYLLTDRTMEAKDMLARAIAICDEAEPGGSATGAEALAMMAEVCRIRHAYSDAAPLFRRALTMLQATVGPTHELVASTLENFAKLHLDQDRELESENMMAEAQKIRDQLSAVA